VSHEIEGALTPWRPTAAEPWNLRRAVHLHRRAAFGARSSELMRDLADGPDAAIDRLLAGNARHGVDERFEAASGSLRRTALQSGQVGRLQAWWIHRMLSGPDPLTEKLTLLWHDHFATSDEKVQNLGWMAQQNGTLRAGARGRFGALLDAMLRDAALLKWLDAPANLKGHPNENLARELLELFTLGVGHYAERDVREAARALSGYTLQDGKAVLEPGQHDDGEKVIIGVRGRFDPASLAAPLLEHPATAARLAWRLEGVFFGEGVMAPAVRSALTERLRETNLDLGDAAALLLRSRLFWSEENIGARLVSPVELAVTLARTLELDVAGISSAQLADWAGRMGQELFRPPNVGGWPAGRAWLDTQRSIERANFASAVAASTLLRRPRDWSAWCTAHPTDARSDEPIACLSRLLTGDHLAGGPDSPTTPGQLLASVDVQLG
jgi:uncharacterized protein (DUF1800 family)